MSPLPSDTAIAKVQEWRETCAVSFSAQADRKDISSVAAAWIANAFSCATYTDRNRGDASRRALAEFIAVRVCTFKQTSLCRTGLPDYVIVAALMLLDRLKTKYPFAKGTSGKRLYFTTFMIASKLISDGTFSGKNWRIIAQNEFSIPEINRMEREMCSHLEWQLHVSAAYIDDFLQKITASFEDSTLLEAVTNPRPN